MVPPLILRTLDLDLQNLHQPALYTLDVVISVSAVKSLSASEYGGVLLKWAEIHLAFNDCRPSDQAFANLNESGQLSPENRQAFCLLGECYEQKGVAESARRAFESALKIDASLTLARKGLQRLSVASRSS